MASGWFCRVLGQLLGPMPLQQVIELARNGNLLREDMVRKKTGEWVAAGTIKGLFAAEPAAAETPPAAAPESVAAVQPAPLEA